MARAGDPPRGPFPLSVRARRARAPIQEAQASTYHVLCELVR